MTRIRVEITTEDIAAGERGACTTCPVARAASRVAPGRDIVVTGSTIAWQWGDIYHLTPLPASIVRWIKRFDVIGPEAVSPVAFEMEVARK